MKDPKERFTETAEAYERFRPSYPRELVDWVIATARLSPPDRIADVGCGTGISTRLLAERGFDVVGVDPNEEMLRLARRHGGRFVRAEAAATGLGGASVALVVSGQAFHWFELEKALPELRRVLAPGGTVAAFWNRRSSTPFLDEYDALLRRHSKEYRSLPGPSETISRIRAHPLVRGVREAEFANGQEFDRDGLFGRAYSSSYVIHGVADRAAFDRDLAAIFERHQRGGRVDFSYRTVAIAWTIT